jgi:hypothetical protein
LRTIGSKIYIEWDGLKLGVTVNLLEKGVAKEDIIIGFIRPEQQKLIDFSYI